LDNPSCLVPGAKNTSLAPASTLERNNFTVTEELNRTNPSKVQLESGKSALADLHLRYFSSKFANAKKAYFQVSTLATTTSPVTILNQNPVPKVSFDTRFSFQEPSRQVSSTVDFNISDDFVSPVQSPMLAGHYFDRFSLAYLKSKSNLTSYRSTSEGLSVSKINENFRQVAAVPPTLARSKSTTVNLDLVGDKSSISTAEATTTASTYI
jgi:hypothetical protein